MSMSCSKPIEIYWNAVKHKHQFKYTLDCTTQPIYVDCNKCSACQQKFIAQLGTRARHELLYHSQAMFITLTVANEHIDEVFPNQELHHRAFQLFMKRYRRSLDREYKNNPQDKPRISYIMCGEYGENYGRPHYHAVIFGHEFQDMKLHHVKGGTKGLFRSTKLEKLWPYGYSTISKVNYEKCTYLAKYVAKARGEDKTNYQSLDLETGEIYYKKKPYLVYPKQGLGRQYYMDNHKVILRQGYFNLPMKNKQQGDKKTPAKVGIPRFYKTLAERYHGELYNEYMERMLPIIEERNLDYITKKVLKNSKELKPVLIMAELTGMEQAETMKVLSKWVSPTEIYEQKLKDGILREKIAESKNRNMSKVHRHV